MANSKNGSNYYEALIWLLLTEYKDNKYTPSNYLLSTIKPKIEQASQGTPIQIYDGSVIDFKLTTNFKDYLDLFITGTAKFETALVILSYNAEKYIPRDFYLANLAKQYTCWDTAYICCPKDSKIKSKAFDFILTEDDLPDKLTEIINGNR